MIGCGPAGKHPDFPHDLFLAATRVYPHRTAGIFQPEHVDTTDPAQPLVYVAYDDKRWAKKERKIPATAEFTPAFKSYIEEFQPARKLFEMLPQWSINWSNGWPATPR